jgi:hypothetical protein
LIVFNKKRRLKNKFQTAHRYFTCRLSHHISESITGTSTSTPTTVANAAPECKPNKEIATATANSKKLLVPIKHAGAEISSGQRRFAGYCHRTQIV